MTEVDMHIHSQTHTQPSHAHIHLLMTGRSGQIGRRSQSSQINYLQGVCVSLPSLVLTIVMMWQGLVCSIYQDNVTEWGISGHGASALVAHPTLKVAKTVQSQVSTHPNTTLDIARTNTPTNLQNKQVRWVVSSVSKIIYYKWNTI